MSSIGKTASFLAAAMFAGVIIDDADNCVGVGNPTREDADGVGDPCDHCAETPESADVDRRGCAEGQTPATGE